MMVWVVSAVLAIPTIFIFVHVEVGEVRKGFWCIKDHGSDSWIISYEMYMLTLLFLLPLIVMLLAYTIIAVKVWRVSDMRAAGRIIPPGESGWNRSGTKSKNGGNRALLGNMGSHVPHRHFRQGKRQIVDERETRRQVVLMLVTVLLLFVLCWAPILINNVLTAWGHLHQLHYGFLKPMRQAFFLLSYLNSCLNPIVYAFFSHNFRQSFKLAICGFLRGKAFVRAYRYSLSAASTRVSTTRFTYPLRMANGRVLETSGIGLSQYERELAGTSSENDMTRSPTSYSCSTPEIMELHKLSP